MPDYSLHKVFDIFAYAVALLGYFLIGTRCRRSERPMVYNLLIVGAILFGGALFARLTVQFASGFPTDPASFFKGMRAGGKTVVGGFLGAILGVKLVKLVLPRSAYITADRNIGDQVIVPFGLGVMIGRIGCLLSGLSDDTHGMPTHAGWGFNYGDGILRHPTQLYEIAGMALILGGLLFFWQRLTRYGLRFQIFVFGFCLLRFCIEFVGVHPRPYFGLSVYQVISLAGMVWSFFLFAPPVKLSDEGPAV
jgi:prolipoprotein diacylglyceryltransferase